MDARRALGKRSEDVAARSCSGGAIRSSTNGSVPRCGEIDIVARDGAVLVFVE
jgi:Holliday junction resolvase-like predicted endonuclease